MSSDLLTGTTLRERAGGAVGDLHLQNALANATDRFILGRSLGSAAVTNFDDLRTAARGVRADIMRRLPDILDRLATNVEANGGHVHWAADGADAVAAITGIIDRHDAKLVVKGKSMASEEIHLNDALERRGVEVVETDLGEWIIQLAKEPPSHIIAPAIHKTRRDIQKLFNRIAGGDLSDVPEELCAFAREQLREKFLAADVGITGVNFGIAETGSTLIVTNEGNGRLTSSVPRVHVAIMGMERVVETWEQLELMLAILARSATGQQTTSYVSTTTGPRRAGEVDGPDEFHLVILDNGRSEILEGEFREALNCIRCGACLNVCPVYRQLGGHGYGWVYSGPIGAVLTPLLNRQPEANELQDASSLCSACWEVCPVRIPLQDLLLGLRRRKATSVSGAQAAAWRAWSETWSRPRAYRATTRLAGAGGRFLPEGLVPPRWTDGRTVPRPRGGDFRSRFERGEI